MATPEDSSAKKNFVLFLNGGGEREKPPIWSESGPSKTYALRSLSELPALKSQFDPQWPIARGLSCSRYGRTFNLSAHSALIPNSLMSGGHFLITASCNARRASGFCWSAGIISSPRSTSRDRVAASARASMTAALSLLMMSLGVPFGGGMGGNLGARR